MARYQKSVLITGCSDGGLGSALAIKLHNTGYRVFATARNTSKMSSLPKDIERLSLDVTSRESINACCAEVATRTGGALNMLINNAGLWHSMPFADTDADAARTVFEVNFWGVFDVTKAFLPLLLESQKQGQKTTLVFVTSLAGSGPTPFTVVYGASKAAADYLFETLRLELSPWKVNTVLLKTGAVKSNIMANRAKNSQERTALPPDSIYNVAKDQVEHFLSGEAAEGFVPTDEWARMVVSNLEKPTPPHHVWGGGYSTIAWAMQWLPVPQSMMQGIVNKIAGLTAVQRAVEDKSKQK